MKKKSLLFLSTLLMSFSLFSCNKVDTNKVNLDYGNLHSYSISEITQIKETTYNELLSTVNNKESFMLAIYHHGCGCWDAFQPVLTQFVNKYHIDIKYIDASAIRAHDDTFNLYLIDGDMPSIAFFRRGKLLRQVTYISSNQETRKIFAQFSEFEKCVLKNVNLPKMYYVDEDVLDSYIAEGKDFNLYIARNGCGDCKELNSRKLYKWNDAKAKRNENLYIFDMQSYRDLDPVEHRYQEVKNKYGLSTVNNSALGYDFYDKRGDLNQGAFPTLQRRVNGQISDMMVVYNDIFEKDESGKYTFTTSYFNESRVANMSFLKGDTSYIYEGKEIPSKYIEVIKYEEFEFESLKKEFYNEVIDLYFDTYIK